MLPRVHHQTSGWDSAEQIRRREVCRVLQKMDLSPEEEEAVKRLSYSLMAKVLLGPIFEVMTRAELRTSHRERGIERTVARSE